MKQAIDQVIPVSVKRRDPGPTLRRPDPCFFLPTELHRGSRFHPRLQPPLARPAASRRAWNERGRCVRDVQTNQNSEDVIDVLYVQRVTQLEDERETQPADGDADQPVDRYLPDDLRRTIAEPGPSPHILRDPAADLLLTLFLAMLLNCRRRYEVKFKPRAGDKTVPVRKVMAQHIGHLITVRGIVTRVTDVKPQATTITYTCDQCGCEAYQEVKGRNFMPQVECMSRECRIANTKGRLLMQTRGSKFEKFQELR